MGCFQLLKGQCAQLSTIASRFWWGDAEGKKKGALDECVRAKREAEWGLEITMILIKRC
jgi:hypothetical protein